MSKQWQIARKHDLYYKSAKAEGYRSRAAYKLKQINNKFKIFHRGDKVLDLGASPGGWSQVAAEKVGTEGSIIGVDLEHINPLDQDNLIFLIGDITDAGTIDLIKEHLRGSEVDVVMSDAAPNISGNYDLDQARSVYLAEAALDLSKILLKRNGKFVVKVFEGMDFKEFMDRIRNTFKKCKLYSPKASRARSSEIYVIGLGLIK